MVACHVEPRHYYCHVACPVYTTHEVWVRITQTREAAVSNSAIFECNQGKGSVFKKIWDHPHGIPLKEGRAFPGSSAIVLKLPRELSCVQKGPRTS